jgi:hypothetical protein
MSFGYLGDISTKIKQVVKNKGVISIAEAYKLEKLGHLGGSQELIQKITISSDATVEFTALQGRMRVGGGQREVAETTLGVQFYTSSSGGFASGTVTLYGIKE